MSNDYSRWIENGVYNSAKQRITQLNIERARSDRKVSDAKRRLDQIDSKIANQSSIDRKELEGKLSRESKRLFDNIENVEERVRMELGQQNLRNREQLDNVRREVGNVNVRVGQIGHRINELATTITENINEVMSKIRNQEARAGAYYNQMRALIEDISELHPDKLSPTDYSKLEQHLASVKSNIDAKDFSAAISLAQNNIPVATELLTRLELLNDEFSKIIVQIHEQCDALHTRIICLSKEDNNKFDIRLNPVEIISFDGRISFWTNGLYDDVIENYEQIRIQVETDFEINMDIDSLKQALTEIEAVNQRLDECVSLAQNEYVEYINLVNLIERIHNAISSENSWILCKSGFVSDDERRSFSMTYENANGLIAVFVIVPVRSVIRRKKDGSNEYSETHFNVSIFQKNDDDDELCNLTRNGVLAILFEHGIEFNNNRLTSSELSAEGFISYVATAGDKIKNERILETKEKIGL